MSFDKILVANRGEIAVRIIRTAREQGYRTVAVYSEADRNALHAQLADEAVCIGPPAVTESYLNSDAILAAAVRTGAQAVHPGYGLLSENAEFAERVQQAGLTFIGPPPPAIALMGSKRLSKLAMEKAGVPCVPGYQGDAQDDDTLCREAERIGFPLMIKASAGGGGRGMRLVEAKAGLKAQLKSARSEARSAFGSDELILERAIIKPRHIEIQVFADRSGEVVFLWERDCSVQRRHQKVIEEAPSPFVQQDLRMALGKAACDAARACNYEGAGTVEFLVDEDGHFYFLEMNTRLQVEHPVTELITGTDLVKWQLDIAQGDPLPLRQDEIPLQGHAMEVRLYAEDAEHGFIPQTGPVHLWHPPEGPHIRVDHGIREGSDITPHYDPMLAKIITWGETREQARRRLANAIEDTVLLGTRCNQHFLAAILRHPVFIQGEATTAFITEHLPQAERVSQEIPETDLATAAVLFYRAQANHHLPLLRDWQSSLQSAWPMELEIYGQTHALTIQATAANCYQINLANSTIEIEMLNCSAQKATLVIDGVRVNRFFKVAQTKLWLYTANGQVLFNQQIHEGGNATEESGNGQITAPMDGIIVDIMVQVGQDVQTGDTLALLEAMKMEHPLTANCDGAVNALHIAKGDQVSLRQQLIDITPVTQEQ